ncbi:MAG: hypothetical protein ACLT40_07255 [Fusobacterium sp.]
MASLNEIEKQIDYRDQKKIIIPLGGDIASYTMYAIAIIKNEDSINYNSCFIGELRSHRSNGLYGCVHAQISMERSYNSRKINASVLNLGHPCEYLYPCTFSYGGVKYGGIVFKPSNANVCFLNLIGDFINEKVFAIPYYNTDTGTIIDNEIYKTIDFSSNAVNNTEGLTYNRRKIWTSGDIITNACWNDYAELFERGEETEPGDIICFDTNSPLIERYIKADSSSKRVIGVHSDTYGHLIGGEKLENYEDNFKKFIPIGLAGRVNVKVKGKVELGDYIVPSDEKGIGRAYNKDTDDRDLIIGYLVEADEHEDVRRLKMFINKK